MTTLEFYKLVEQETTKTKDNIENMPLDKLTVFIKEKFGKTLVIKLI